MQPTHTDQALSFGAYQNQTLPTKSKVCRVGSSDHDLDYIKDYLGAILFDAASRRSQELVQTDTAAQNLV